MEETKENREFKLANDQYETVLILFIVLLKANLINRRNLKQLIDTFNKVVAEKGFHPKTFIEEEIKKITPQRRTIM